MTKEERTMESELIKLQRRMAELEAMLAAVAAQQRPPRRSSWMVRGGMFCAGIITMLLVRGLAPSVAAQGGSTGPSKVTAPFEVVDGKGRTLFRVQMSASGAGLGVFFDDSGDEVAVIGHAAGSDKPVIQVLSKGILKAGMGFDESGGGGSASFFSKSGVPAAEIRSTGDGAGLIRVNWSGKTRIELGIAKTGNAGNIALTSDSTQASTILHGDVGIRQTNAQGQPAAQLGVDDNGQGYFMAANRAGSFLSKLSVASDGSSGRVEVSQGGENKVLMGVLANSKGDVCATGAPGRQVCLSGLALKSLIPY